VSLRTRPLWLDDQLAATLRDEGSATTGELRRSLAGVLIGRKLGRCRCRCGQVGHDEIRQLPVDSVEVRAALKRLAKQNRVVEIPRPGSNNGGHLWLWLDPEEDR